MNRGITLHLVERENKLLFTLQKKKPFKYKGSVDTGITLYFGYQFDREKSIKKEQLVQLIREFSGQKVLIGTSRNDAPEESLGHWLQTNVSRTALASYVAPILIKEGYAYQEDISTMEITFFGLRLEEDFIALIL